MIALPDGKVLLGGWTRLAQNDPDELLLLYRLTHQGDIDTTFGGNGVVVHQLSTAQDELSEMRLLPDGRIIGVGRAGNQRILMRFLPDGSLDSDFSEDGIVELDPYNYDFGYQVFTQPNGHITVYLFGGGMSAHRIRRFLPDGTPDPSYGINGIADIPLTMTNGQHCTMLADGRVLVSRRTSDNLGILCVTNEGTIDPDFGIEGYAMPGVFTQTSGVGALAAGPEQRFAAVTSAPNGAPFTEENDIAAYMYFADSLWNQSTTVEAIERASPALFPSVYPGGALWLTTDRSMRDARWCVVDDRGRIVRDLPLSDRSTAIAYDIGPFIGDLRDGLYFVTCIDATGTRNTARFVVLH